MIRYNASCSYDGIVAQDQILLTASILLRKMVQQQGLIFITHSRCELI